MPTQWALSQIANIVYKHKQDVLPPAFKNYFIWVVEYHDRVTHNANKLCNL